MVSDPIKITVLREPFDKATNVDVTNCFHIEFEMHSRFRGRIRVSVQDGRILINGDNGLDIRPHATNAFSVGFVQD